MLKRRYEREIRRKRCLLFYHLYPNFYSKGTAIDPKLMAAYKADLSRQGWVMRDKKKRMLELAVGRLSELDAQLKPKLIIPLENASITQVGAVQSIHKQLLMLFLV